MLMATDREQQESAQVQAFVTELMGIANAFSWSVDRWGQIRGRFIDIPRFKRICPIRAVAFMGTKHMYLTPHEAADSLAMSGVSLDLTDAVDNKRSQNETSARWRKWILEALNLKEV